MITGIQAVVSFLDASNSAVDLEKLRELLVKTDLSVEDVKSYCVFSDVGYTRNLVSSSKWYELLVLCWKPGQVSAIHDHFGSSCCFRILSGTAQETNYEIVPQGAAGVVRPVGTRSVAKDGICASTSAHIHRISNPSSSENLVTLHCYSPPLHMNTYMVDPVYIKNAAAARAV